MTITIPTTNSLPDAARQFVDSIGTHRVFAFYGQMGAGKTTFIKAICEVLGVTDVITSPTFAIVNEYTLPAEANAPLDPQGRLPEQESSIPLSQSDRVYHFDFYRIKKLDEVYDMGYEDYFYSGALCFIEWPELIDDLLPSDAVRVHLTVLPDGSRSVTMK